ncbi:hypothetical protein Pmani_007014 [Petrolisthes manimaculis]|uniref:Uncharacterized protein n=1 Tax=Petrolisthes manimaculis TaxID=1843537 RepID=A0AAE1Q982_9EUCA|nr:hypothetical protein Pmani_007014 [Petrolisthes manimaculis]
MSQPLVEHLPTPRVIRSRDDATSETVALLNKRDVLPLDSSLTHELWTEEYLPCRRTCLACIKPTILKPECTELSGGDED